MLSISAWFWRIELKFDGVSWSWEARFLEHTLSSKGFKTEEEAFKHWENLAKSQCFTWSKT